MQPKDFIHIKGARTHNLQDVELRLPRNRITVLTGVSGSGKSSLAFDTLYAEGYRKFMDSLSPRARMLLEQAPKPDVDFIHGLSPVIAVEQREAAGSNPRSTVATVTEIADYARLLWALAGVPHCPKDGGRIERRSLDDCLDRVFNEPEGSRLLIIAPLFKAKTSVIRGELTHLRMKGFQRIRIDGQVSEVDDVDALPSGKEEHQLDVVIDRIVLRPDQRSRLADSLEIAFKEGQDQAIVSLQGPDRGIWRDIPLSQHLSCSICASVYQPVTPKLFSHDHPRGACPTCGGLGETLQFREELVVPDPSKSVRNGAIKPWRLGSKRMIIQRNAMLKQLSEQIPFDPKIPWNELADSVKDILLHGDPERLYDFKLKGGNSKPVPTRFEGVLADLESTRRETSSDGLRQKLLLYQTRKLCPDCQGQRLSAEARAVLVEGLSFSAFMRLSLKEAYAVVRGWSFPQLEDAIQGLQHRLQFLNQVGLGYLSLNRPYASLSGGEAQRARLASHLGMGLVGVTYVLDEPTIGLHPTDTERLIESVRTLRDQGNTVVLVEHDGDVIEAADRLIELGPGAGANGGRIVFEGAVGEAKANPKCITGQFLSGRTRIEAGGNRMQPTPGAQIEILGASEHNLKNVDAAFPIGCLTGVTGVSGSGKSTLITEILAKAASMRLNRSKQIPGRHKGLKGMEHFDRMVLVDQEPIGRSPRSNPATYVKLFDDLRRLFAQCPLSKVRGYKANRFSFNVRGGRCERCQGDGAIRMDMQFLHDVYGECPSCQGRRYNRETLEVRFRGANIADVLDMTVEQALEFFQNQPPIRAKLETLAAVGLGYLHLGQASNTLSGGEAQRIKLSLELSKGRRGQTLYILDEPTTGLHWVDIQHLMDLLFQLRDQGHTLILIEHNMDVIRLLDWVIDLGPGGGSAGGEIIYAGPINGLSKVESSQTGKWL